MAAPRGPKEKSYGIFWNGEYWTSLRAKTDAEALIKLDEYISHTGNRYRASGFWAGRYLRGNWRKVTL